MQRLIRHKEQAAAEKRLLRMEGAPRSLVYALGTLLVCLLASYLFLLRLEHDRLAQEQEKTGYIVESYATKMRYVITNAFSSAYLVAALVRQGNGAVEDFESYAAELVKMHPSTININLAPGGVVSRVFPYERNTIFFPTPPAPRKPSLPAIRAAPPSPGPFRWCRAGAAWPYAFPCSCTTTSGPIPSGGSSA